MTKSPPSGIFTLFGKTQTNTISKQNISVLIAVRAKKKMVSRDRESTGRAGEGYVWYAG